MLNFGGVAGKSPFWKKKQIHLHSWLFVIVMLVFRVFFRPAGNQHRGNFLRTFVLALLKVNIFRYFDPKKQLGTPTMNFTKLVHLYFRNFRIFDLHLTHVPFSLRWENPLSGSNLPAKVGPECWDIPMSNEKKPGCLGFVGLYTRYTTQLCGDYFMNHSKDAVFKKTSI